MPADMKPTRSIARHEADEQTSLRPFGHRSAPDHTAHLTSGSGYVPSSAQTPDQVPQRAPIPGAQVIELKVSVTAAIVATSRDEPVVLTTTRAGLDTLPSAHFHAGAQPSLDACLREGVAEQTGLGLGYVEQLVARADGHRELGIGYLALTRTTAGASSGAAWRSWYDYLPWEDWRGGRPAILATHIEPRLRSWANDPAALPDPTRGLTAIERARMAFGLDRAPWNEERVIDRFDLLCETGLIGTQGLPARTMRLEHLRMLASAIGRLRAKLKIRPVIFELMDGEFTLFELQKTVEAILGPHLHKQNFRRLIESAGLVEATGDVRSKTGGRPAKLFRFRHEVLMERPAPGVRVHAQHA